MKKFLIPVAFLVIIGLLLTACGTSTTTPTTATTSTSAPVTTAPISTTAPLTSTTSTTPATTPVSNVQKGGTLRILYPYSPSEGVGWPDDRTNPQILWTEWVMFEPLVKPKADGTVVPWLATSWEWGTQNLSITFTLRQGVKFQDGTPFNADAVKFEGDVVLNAKESNSANWDSWTIVDDSHVRLNLKTYTNDFWSSLAGVNMTFASPTAFRAHDQAWMIDHPIGTGPFKFKSFEKDVSLEFVKNPDYWQPGLPYLDEIDFITVKQTQTGLATMQSDGGDLYVLQMGQDLANMKQKGYTILYNYGGTDNLLFDSADPTSPFANLLVRQAVDYALDKKSMSDALGYGFTVPNDQMPPPNNPAYNPNVKARDYDPAKAKALLTQAGYPNGFKTNLYTTDTAGKALSEQQFLQAVGIDVQLQLVDNAKYWNYAMQGWTGGLLDGSYAVGTNWPSWMRMYFPPTGIFDVSTKVPDAIVAKLLPALQETDPAKAKALSDEIVQMVFDDATLVPVYSNALGHIASPKVHNSGYYDWVDWSAWSPELCWLSK